MPEQPNRPWAAFLMVVKIETAPAPLLYPAVLELQEMLKPVIASNRRFLASLPPILQLRGKSADTDALLEAARLAIRFEASAKDAALKIARSNPLDEAALREAAQAAQYLGHLALLLKQETAQVQQNHSADTLTCEELE
ncbi:hypothetical protein AB9K35_18075 [Leisingera sp. XS_AS12]|uniref:hypothetical protein n=1 Tax=Leisingera sp. XS_AS12 TaxID=3241294 RepID=UPI003514B0CA